jgi:glycosyltransferase involved in cell wall biosynthesis
MRLMIVCSTLHVGGAEYVAALLAKALDRRRFDVTVCCLKENGVVGEEIERAGVPLVTLPRKSTTRVDYFTAFKLLRELRARGVQIVHTHDVHGLWDGALCRLVSPGLRHVHTFHYGNYPRPPSTSRSIERLMWRAPDALVAVGHRQAAGISAAYGIDASRLKVIRNGVDRARADIATEVRQAVANESRPVIGSVSTLIPQKGLPCLLEAAASLRNSGHEFLLLLIGEGNLRPQLEQQIASLGLHDNVRMLGWVTEASRRALPACDVFVQSSLWEAMSVVVLEAMALGKPMVVTRVGENEHTVEDGRTGLLVPPGDATALASALGRLLDDRQLRSRLGDAARRRYDELFTAERMAEEYASLYAALVATSHAERARPAK